MTTPMSLQPWWWQLRSQFFQMFVYGDVVYAQTWYWPWKTVSSHLHMRGRPMLLQYGPHFFSTLSEKFGQLARFFWANGLPPPLAKNFPYAYEGGFSFARTSQQTMTGPVSLKMKSAFSKSFYWKTFSFVHTIYDLTDLAGEFWLKVKLSLRREGSGRSVLTNGSESALSFNIHLFEPLFKHLGSNLCWVCILEQIICVSSIKYKRLQKDQCLDFTNNKSHTNGGGLYVLWHESHDTLE